MIYQIQRDINRKVRDIRSASSRPHPFGYEEICARIGLIFRAGLDRDSMTDTSDLWSPIEGRSSFRAIVSEKRFVFFSVMSSSRQLSNA